MILYLFNDNQLMIKNDSDHGLRVRLFDLDSISFVSGITKSHTIVNSFILSCLGLNIDKLQFTISQIVPLSYEFPMLLEGFLMKRLYLDTMILVLH